MTILFFFIAFWATCLSLLWIWKRGLFIKTWSEPYFASTAVLIESDDWGPGGDFHADRLNILLACLSTHKDSINRTAVLTADVVLSIPDVNKIIQSSNAEYHRKTLDQDFPDIYKSMQYGIKNGTLVAQLHGMEHLNGKAFAKLCQQNDARTEQAQTTSNWWDWESLDSPLQGHYVDGSRLPTVAISTLEAKDIIQQATATFQRIFGYPSYSTVAPCYLWNNEIEQIWMQHHVQAIQTAGYRCSGRDTTGTYQQDLKLIRPGEKNPWGQTYLVRNVMYEPVDGKNTPETAFIEAETAYNQALPITISTHRYNYTRSEEDFKSSLDGLDCLLTKINAELSELRFLSSPELGEQMKNPGGKVINHGNNKNWPGLQFLCGLPKCRTFLYRLYYRHPKLVLLSYATGLVIPAWIICKIGNNRTRDIIR